MYIIIQCGGMPFNGETIKNSSLGGSETAAYYLAKELAAVGHDVTLFTNSQEEGVWDGVQYRWAGVQSDQTPLGARYHTFAVATPHDLNITQRHPYAFHIPVAAKVTALWLHDIPVPEYRDAVLAGLPRTDLIFTVSEWQKGEVSRVWGINPDNIVSVENGIDLKLFEEDEFDVPVPVQTDRFNMLYSSRPERGLETLVKPGGIMERLLEECPQAHLYVCGYDNVTGPMTPYYNWLFGRCEALQNVTPLGHLTKVELAGIMRQCDLLAYPTKFWETSCITAMESMAAGLPFLSSHLGALPETCKESGSILMPPIPADPRPGTMEVGDQTLQVDVPMFTRAIKTIANEKAENIERLREMQREAAKRHTWDLVAGRVLAAVEGVFQKAHPNAIAKSLLRNSDIYALRHFLEQPSDGRGVVSDKVLYELEECYDFTLEDDWSDHYRRYYEYEKERGVNYGPENLDGNDRFEFVSSVIASLPDGATVLDYGCAHGHYTVNLAKRFPRLDFVGVDITPSNIEKARKWAEDAGAGNTEFIVGQVIDGRLQSTEFEGLSSLVQEDLGGFDAIIAAEVLEHVARPQAIVDTLKAHLLDTGIFITTTPYGPWEAMGYEEHWPWRAHVHHFERADLKDLFGHFPQFSITTISSGRSPLGEPLGSYACIFSKSAEPCGEVDYERKLSHLNPQQTLSVCMIVRDAEDSVGKTIKSLAKVADEFVIAVDEQTSDETVDVIFDTVYKHCKRTPVKVFTAKSPREIGFDAARNATVQRAGMDWILWVDADEIIDGAENIPRYLRNNPYQALNMPHHHFSVEPAGILKTDYPARMFRNGLGIEFFGVVHEHPEIQYNKGITYGAVVSDVAVAHYGYQNEPTRRGRFERNWPLMLKDREKYPDRNLGRFLYLRDLWQLSAWELEAGGYVTKTIQDRIKEGITLWESIVRTGPLRFAIESLEWYSGLVKMLDTGRPLSFAIGRREDVKDAVVGQGVFYSEEHENLLISRILKEV